jgi:hypothetical protein
MRQALLVRWVLGASWLPYVLSFRVLVDLNAFSPAELERVP